MIAGKMIRNKTPAYTQVLTPVLPRSAEQKCAPYANLDRLVDVVAESRFPGKKLSPLERKQVASSLMNRPDQKSSFQIKTPLAKTQGLFAFATSSLQTIAGDTLDLDPIAEWIFSSNDSIALAEKLQTLKLSSEKKHQLYARARSLRQELEHITNSTMQYIRPPQKTDGMAYMDDTGEVHVLSHTIPSSFDRTNPELQNGRFNLNSQGHVIYSTGRVDTERKGSQATDAIIEQTLRSGQITEGDLIKQPDGSYLFPIVMENLINPSPIGTQERKYLKEQDKTLQNLKGKTRYGHLKNGKIVKLTLQPIHFSTQSNYNYFFGQSNRWSSTGSDLAEQISDSGLQALEDICNARKLPEKDRKTLNFCFRELKKRPSAEDRYILRAFICEKLNIPYHINCKSSKDRTAVLGAIKKAVHQWLQLDTWQGKDTSTLDPRTLLNNPSFREYSEAALFENLPMTDQGIGISGTLDGKTYTQDRGFAFRYSLIENPIASFVISDRYLYTPSVLTRALYTLSMSLVSLVAAAAYLTLLPIILPVLHYKFKDKAIDVAAYIGLMLIVFPPLSASREKWLDRSSPVLQALRFFRSSSKANVAPKLQELFDDVDALSSKEYQNLIKFIKTGKSLNEGHTALFKEIGDQWVTLQRLMEAKEPMPSRMKEILQAAPKSPVLLFQYLTKFSKPVLWKELEKDIIQWASDNWIAEIICKGVNNQNGKPFTTQFLKDYDRTHFVMQGKKHTHDFPIKEDENRLQKLTDALQEWPIFKEGVPLGAQEALTQSMALTYILVPIFSSCNSDKHMPPNASDRTFVIEENDESSFWLTIQEKSTIQSISTKASSISFDYTYRFKISKKDPTTWTTTLVSLSTVQPKMEESFWSLLEASTPIALDTAVSQMMFSHVLHQFERNLEATSRCGDPDHLTKIETQIQKQWHILTTQFGPKIAQTMNLEEKKFHLKKLNNFLLQSKTEAGRLLIGHYLDQYLHLVFDFSKRSETVFFVLLDQMKLNLEAACKCTDPKQVEKIRIQIAKQLDFASRQFGSNSWGIRTTHQTDADKREQHWVDSHNLGKTAQTGAGRKLIEDYLFGYSCFAFRDFWAEIKPLYDNHFRTTLPFFEKVPGFRHKISGSPVYQLHPDVPQKRVRYQRKPKA